MEEYFRSWFPESVELLDEHCELGVGNIVEFFRDFAQKMREHAGSDGELVMGMKHGDLNGPLHAR